MPAPLWRRLAAATYDALLLAAIWMSAALADAILRTLADLPANAHVLRAVLFMLGLLYCARSWTRGGQTLGMRAWRLQLRRVDGDPIGWPVAAARYAFAWIAWLPLGGGVLWSALDPRRRAWHDIWSGTELVLLPRPGA
jgi:uncharacterized RDD family membrane protein YckC